MPTDQELLQAITAIVQATEVRPARRLDQLYRLLMKAGIIRAASQEE